MTLKVFDRLDLRVHIEISTRILCSLISVTTTLNDRRTKYKLRLFMVLIIGEELFLLVHELILFHWASLRVSNRTCIQYLTVRLEILLTKLYSIL